MAAPLNRKSASHAHFSEFCVPCDCSGEDCSWTVLTDVARFQLWRGHVFFRFGVLIDWQLHMWRYSDRCRCSRRNKTAEIPHVALIDRILYTSRCQDKFPLSEQCRNRKSFTGPVHREDCGAAELEEVSEQWVLLQTLFLNNVVVIQVVCHRQQFL